VEQASTVAGRGTRTCQIVGMSIVKTTVVNTLLEVRNPGAAVTALTITPNAGGPDPVSAHLVIVRIQ
jgi:hypothetical protein